ncbi:MAG TPA: rhomboid family intramembrane serine protease [Planctomycetaceae bacterium]|nr:rhomboid family intramembrane serine protease [Planctomycetaceae bacterium]
MRRIGTLRNEQHARRFHDYLLSIGIKSMVEQTEDGWPVWVYDEDLVERAREEFDHYQRHPEDERYWEAAREAERLRKQQARENAEARKRLIDMRSRWERPFFRRCPVTFWLIAVSVAVTLMTQFGQPGHALLNKLTINSFELNGRMVQWRPGLHDVQQGQVWRLVTPIFLHFGVVHLLFNTWMTYSLGAAVEFRRGSGRTALLVLAIAIPSNVGQYYFSGPLFGGLSGVVYGLFGYVWMKSRFDPNSGLSMPQSTVLILLGWFVLCLMDVIPNVANVVHGVGLAVGIVIGFLPTWLSRRT